eukprot:362380-Chlamydomonas_euryale.AAC.2
MGSGAGGTDKQGFPEHDEEKPGRVKAPEAQRRAVTQRGTAQRNVARRGAAPSAQEPCRRGASARGALSPPHPPLLARIRLPMPRHGCVPVLRRGRGSRRCGGIVPSSQVGLSRRTTAAADSPDASAEAHRPRISQSARRSILAARASACLRMRERCVLGGEAERGAGEEMGSPCDAARLAPGAHAARPVSATPAAAPIAQSGQGWGPRRR